MFSAIHRFTLLHMSPAAADSIGMLEKMLTRLQRRLSSRGKDSYKHMRAFQALQKLWPRAPAALHREVSTLQRAGGCAPPWLQRSSPAGVRAVRTSAALGLMRLSRRDWGKLQVPRGGAFGAFVIKDQSRADVRHCSVAAQSISTSNVQEPVEGMPRYPNTTPMGILRGLDYFGTVVFAATGSITAASVGMDLLGSMVLGTITAVGGGTFRDVVVLGRRPFWSDGEYEYLNMSLAAAAAMFFLWPMLQDMGVDENGTIIFVADSIGVGAFCVIGAKNGVKAGMPFAICVACGVMTATFGGVVRDTLAKRPVRILHSHSEIYATTAASGAAAYLIARRMRTPVWVRVSVGFFTAVAMRSLAWTQGFKLPTWSQKVGGGWQVQ